MVGDNQLFGVIPPAVPDNLVPAEKVETATASRQKARRAERFLKGPIPLSWVREHIRDPADRLLLVLRAHADMKGAQELKVSADVLRDADVDDRKILYRALARLEASGSLEVLRKRGSRPIARLKRCRSKN